MGFKKKYYTAKFALIEYIFFLEFASRVKSQNTQVNQLNCI